MSAIEQQIQTPDSTGKKRWRKQIVPVFLWVVFTVGLLIQFFAPRLNIENHAFVMRPALTSQGGEINPGAIVERDREVQWASGLLTLGGAISLAFWYRRRLADALMPERSFHPRGR
jgi:hypothetical protein